MKMPWHFIELTHARARIVSSDSARRSVGTASVLLAILFTGVSCGSPQKEAEKDCQQLGGTYDPSVTPKCSIPLNEAQACAAVGGTYNSSGTPKCAIPLNEAQACGEVGGTYNLGATPKCALSLKCVNATSTVNFTQCKDSGNFASTCADVTCPAGYTLTGGGGACAAGDRRLKALNPNLGQGKFYIMCDAPQGVAPQVTAICCKF